MNNKNSSIAMSLAMYNHNTIQCRVVFKISETSETTTITITFNDYKNILQNLCDFKELSYLLDVGEI